MQSTPGAKPKLGYLQHGQSRQKSKNQSVDSSVQKAKMVIGSDYSDLFSHMNKSNLDYISSQIKEKQKQKRKAQKKMGAQQKQQPPINIEAPQIHSLHVQNPIMEIDASQQETQRSQEDHGLKNEEKLQDLKVQELPAPPSTDRVSGNEPGFIQFLDNYIESLGELPHPPHYPHNHSRQRSPIASHKKSIKQSIKQHPIHIPKSRFAEIDERRMEEVYRALQRKYQKQKVDGSILIGQLQECRKVQDWQKQQIIRLQEKIQLLSRDVEKHRKHKDKVLKKQDLIRSVILSDNHHKSSSSIHQRMRSREVEPSNVEMLNQEYQTFKTHFPKHRR